MFKDKVVVLTGAGSGIGRTLAVQLAEAGSRLALSDIDAAGLAETAQQVQAIASRAAAQTPLLVRGYPLDVASREAVFAHADEVRRDFGAVHFVINNAGTALLGTMAHLSIEEIEWQLGINLWGVVYGTKAFLPMLLAQREGCIVNISSISGFLSLPTQGAYAMSKFAVRALTECLWSELAGTGVRAVSVHPGGVRTNIDKRGRICAAAGNEEAFFAKLAEKSLLTPPEECARVIIRGLRRGDRRIVTGHMSGLLYGISRILPIRYPELLRFLTRFA